MKHATPAAPWRIAVRKAAKARTEAKRLKKKTDAAEERALKAKVALPKQVEGESAEISAARSDLIVAQGLADTYRERANKKAERAAALKPLADAVRHGR